MLGLSFSGSDPRADLIHLCSDPAGSRTIRVNNASVLHSAFEFLAIVCGFDLKVVGDRDVAGIVGLVTYRPVVGSLRQSGLAQALSVAFAVLRPRSEER